MVAGEEEGKGRGGEGVEGEGSGRRWRVARVAPLIYDFF